MVVDLRLWNLKPGFPLPSYEDDEIGLPNKVPNQRCERALLSVCLSR